MIPDINLMPKIEKGEANLKVAYILVGILSLLTVGLLAWMFFSAKDEISSATPQRDALTVTRDKLQAEVSSYESMNQGSLEESVAFVERISYPVSPIIIETQNLLPLNTYLRAYVFSETGVEVEVDFETLSAISTYVSELKKSPYFYDVQVELISNFEINPSIDEQREEHQFNEVPRYEVEINLFIDESYIAAGGDQQ